MASPYEYRFEERERPLKQCPNGACRRAQSCLRTGTGKPCIRTHETIDAFRFRLARKLERLAASVPPPARPLSQYEMERRLGELKQALWEADAKATAEAMAKEKPLALAKVGERAG